MQKKKKILPIFKEPLISAFNVYGSLFSIVPINKKTLPWISSTFIQPRYNGDFISFIDPNFNTCPWIYYQRVHPKILFSKWERVVDFIIDNLELENYVYVKVNQFFIPESPRFQKKHFDHEIFIYGYDKDEQCFYVADNLHNGKYSYVKCPFSLFQSAFETRDPNPDRFDNEFILLQLVEEAEYQFNLEYVVEQLKDYVFPIRMKEKINTYRYLSYAGNTFGIDIYNELIKNIRIVMNDQKITRLDHRHYQILWEHKKCMLLRIEYLTDMGLLKNDADIRKNYNEIEKESLIARNLILKYNITNNNPLLESLISHVIKISETEKQIILKLLEYCEIVN